MKKALKLTLVVVCTMISTSLFAQKFGRINSQEIVTSMNEFKEAQTQIQAYAKDLDAQLETIGVEFNTKLQEFQQSADTLGDAMRQLKEKELNDLQTRYQEFQQMASSDMQKKQMELLQPIQQKCVDAIKEVAQAGGYIVVFDMATGSLAYIDDTHSRGRGQRPRSIPSRQGRGVRGTLHMKECPAYVCIQPRPYTAHSRMPRPIGEAKPWPFGKKSLSWGLQKLHSYL